MKLLSAFGAAVLVAAVGLGQEVYRGVLDTPVEYTGRDRQVAEPGSVDSVAIGVFLPDEDPVGRALMQGIALAVEQANAAGGLDGTPFRLVRRWAADPWSGGAGEVVDLAYEERVWAMIGAIDSASTHVAQQVVTKAQVVLVAPLSSDTSLTYVRVPWIFRLLPDDGRQARVLVSDAILDGGFDNVGILSSSGHDERAFVSEFIAEIQRQGFPPSFHLTLPEDGADPGRVADKVRSFGPAALVVRLPAELRTEYLLALAQAGVACPLLMPWAPELETRPLSSGVLGPIMTIDPMGVARGQRSFRDFEAAFRSRFGEAGCDVAAHGYDAARLIVHAIRSGGLSRAGIRRALAASSGFEGVTGAIVWDNGGGRVGRPILRVVE